jgi:hypothetical protein
MYKGNLGIDFKITRFTRLLERTEITKDTVPPAVTAGD